jgi:hypothetical protein
MADEPADPSFRQEENESAEVPEIFKPFVWVWHHSRRN